MAKARSALAGALLGVRSRAGITDDTWDDLDEALLRADVGIGVTSALLDPLRARVKAVEDRVHIGHGSDRTGATFRRSPKRAVRRVEPMAAVDLSVLVRLLVEPATTSEFFDRIGGDPTGSSRRPLVRSCLDWTERRRHLAGGLGAALLRHLLEIRAVQRQPGTRAVTVTPAGREDLSTAFGIAWPIDGS